MQPMEQQYDSRISKSDTDLIKTIYELTHSVSINDSHELRLRLAELTKEAEKRGLL